MNPAENYILNQPEPFKSILIQLQVLVETTVPEVKLDFKYRLPFYYLNDKPFCYFNASHKKGYVDMCLWNSAHLTVHLDKLVTDGRKVMKSLRYFNMDDINGEVVVELLQEAKSVNHKGFYKS
ncbi:Domain of unknown function DUF1801 [Allomuricauda ruestringensis DSM 13258]|uniref:YdhG-like domain-containing protein n=1 Tax=Allomuricauda ruestringensis (strain DSM 13258 / CIP 107369 / LMG 19739 / B1) TaxID=886377 RepID=G2PSV1_ALLRU|nr:DUF1801 domain-containing protein [Allomuricauda ruestringensis]AEM69578.1 Domain of unknown function DUF1801 [Allomuricauda ruestringensis DSM 13258]